MLVTLESNRRNRNAAFALAGAAAMTSVVAGWFAILSFFRWVSLRSSIGWFDGDAFGG
jgi:hypothetical protein